MKVTVLGPNGINDASFHVHAAGCADIGKAKYRWARGDGVWSADVESAQELIETLFGDFIGTGETCYEKDGETVYTTWKDYANDARVFPCVGLSLDN